jgi:endonuclease III-like uncharacterized protein
MGDNMNWIRSTINNVKEEDAERIMKSISDYLNTTCIYRNNTIYSWGFFNKKTKRFEYSKKFYNKQIENDYNIR